VSIRASLSAAQALIGDQVVLTAVVSNLGSVAAENVVATVAVPVGLLVSQANVPTGEFSG
jgi:uncharacterized repeat protein (TIGR01451 family)